MIDILIHIMPSEIDQLEQTLIHLKKSSKYINDSKSKITVEVCLNLNLVDWNKSKLDKNFFLTKLNFYEKLTSSWATTRFWASHSNEVLGCTDLHRRSGDLYSPDAFIWLDVDIVFSESLLYHLTEAYNQLIAQERYFVITPSTTRIWDETWDCLVHPLAMNEPATHTNYFERDPYLTTGLMGDTIQLKKVNQFKFASGWFNLLSSDLIKKIRIPEAMGSYYMDDTYIMYCCMYGAQKNFFASQYIIDNEIIIENNKFRYNPYKEYIIGIDKKEEYIQKAKLNFEPSIVQFLNTL